MHPSCTHHLTAVKHIDRFRSITHGSLQHLDMETRLYGRAAIVEPHAMTRGKVPHLKRYYWETISSCSILDTVGARNNGKGRRAGLQSGGEHEVAKSVSCFLSSESSLFEHSSLPQYALYVVLTHFNQGLIR